MTEIASDNGILGFERACFDMCSGKYILADKKIANILQAIAASENLVAIFGMCLKTFDFASEFSRSKVPTTSKKTILKLPNERNRMIAYTFCLLMELDNGRRNIINFLNDYFYNDEGVHQEYAAFCSSIIMPFFKYTKILYLESQNNNREVSISEQFFDETSTVVVDSLSQETMQLLMVRVIESISQSTKPNLTERDELLTIANALNHAIMSRNAKFIKILFIGCKSTVALSSLSTALMPDFDTLQSKLMSLHLL